MTTIFNVETTTEARTALPGHLQAFSEQGSDAAPVVIGRQRKPEAVLLSIEGYQRLLEVEELFLAVQTRQRLANDARTPFEDLLGELGLEAQVD